MLQRFLHLATPDRLLLVLLILYPVLARPFKRNHAVFAVVNLLFVNLYLWRSSFTGGSPTVRQSCLLEVLFVGYLGFVLACYWVLNRGQADERLRTSAVVLPIIGLVLLKLGPLSDRFFPAAASGHVGGLTVSGIYLWGIFIGASYLSFRLCLLAVEVQSEVVPLPSISEYFGFAFFFPTLLMGPISPYSMYRSSFAPNDSSQVRVGAAVERFVIGMTKYYILGSIVDQYTYAGLMLDGHPHAFVDLVISFLSYPLFLYFNFSGFIDMAIGISGLLGISVMENFDRPFTARNFQDFWQRWHISLSSFLRDVMFTPLVKSIARRSGRGASEHVVAFGILCVFLVIGLWHGITLSYVIYGLLAGAGVAVAHYSSVRMRKRLGKERYLAFRNNKTYYVAGCVATYVYFAFTLFFFANGWDDVLKLVHVTRF